MSNTQTQGTQQAGNPLAKYFRQPGISIQLPSQYQWYHNNEVETTANGEVPVLPMTAEDEMIMKNPDSLLNGDALEQVIKSCVPNVHNVRALVAPDVEALLLAIRTTSYGDNMEVKVQCPKCSHENTFQVNLRDALESIDYLDSNYTIMLDKNISVEIEPYNYEDMIKATLATFNESQMLRGVERDDSISEEEKRKKFQESYDHIRKLTFELLVNSIIKVRAPEGEVTDRNYIEEFIKNIDRKKLSIIDNKIAEINSVGADKKLKAKCQNEKCGHEWETEVTYDPAHFFG